MGSALSVRDIVSERAIYDRERAVGLAPTSYTASKLIVMGLQTLLHAAILTTAVSLGKPGPDHGVVTDSGIPELVLAIWLTAWTSALLGEIGSALVKSGEQTMPLLVVLVMAVGVLRRHDSGHWPRQSRIGQHDLPRALGLLRRCLGYRAQRSAVWPHQGANVQKRMICGSTPRISSGSTLAFWGLWWSSSPLCCVFASAMPWPRCVGIRRTGLQLACNRLTSFIRSIMRSFGRWTPIPTIEMLPFQRRTMPATHQMNA